jgi:hypothetical protein
MNWLKFAVTLTVCALLVGTLMAADQKSSLNKYGTMDKYTTNFTDPVRVGETVLPKGVYEVTHTMKGEQHIMVFHQINVNKPVEVKVPCTLVKLDAPAPDSRKSYILNDNNERVLKEMEFKGDTAKHVF